MYVIINNEKEFLSGCNKFGNPEFGKRQAFIFSNKETAQNYYDRQGFSLPD
jgi:hypothetical protein